jgi:diguanylate cyclase (GGDEF)-like protein
MWRPLIMTKISSKKLRNTALFLVLLIVAGVLTFRWEQKAGIEEEQQVANRKLTVFGSKLFSPIDKYSYLPAIISAHPEITAALLDPQAEARTHALSKFLAKINASVKSSAIYVMDRDGLTIASSNWNERTSFVGKNYSFRPYFQNAMQGKDSGFYGIGTTSQQAGYFLPHAVNLDGKPIGVVVVKFVLLSLDSLDSSWDSSEGQVAVVDENDVIFLSSEKDWKYRPVRPLSSEVLEKISSTKQYTTALRSPLGIRNHTTLAGVGETISLASSANKHDADTYLVSTLALPDQNWKVEMFSSLQDVNRRALTAAMLVVCLASAIALAILYGQQVRKNVREREASRIALEAAHARLEEKHEELERLAAHLREMATTDPLTGCYNRRYFSELLSKILPGIKRQGASLAMLMIDIDFFKKINDTYGHDAGDAVICAVSSAVRKVARDADVLARFGGEEFVLALPQTGIESALLVGERVRETIAGLRIPSKAGEISVTVSIGAGAFSATDEVIDAAIKRADLALYDAKHGGRNQVRCFIENADEVHTASS